MATLLLAYLTSGAVYTFTSLTEERKQELVEKYGKGWKVYAACVSPVVFGKVVVKTCEELVELAGDYLEKTAKKDTGFSDAEKVEAELAEEQRMEREEREEQELQDAIDCDLESNGKGEK